MLESMVADFSAYENLLMLKSVMYQMRESATTFQLQAMKNGRTVEVEEYGRFEHLFDSLFADICEQINEIEKKGSEDGSDSISSS